MDSSSVTQLANAYTLADHVLVPMDIADSADTGPTSGQAGTSVPVPTLTSPSDHLSRDDALRAMGLDSQYDYVLVQLGASTVTDTSDAREKTISRLLELSPTTHVVVGLSPLSADYMDGRPRVHVVREYPLAAYLAAFDFMVIAAGYNSIHESVRFQIPAVVIPNRHTSTDNQVLRAEEYQRLGFGLAATSTLEVDDAIGRLYNPALRGDFRRALQEATTPLDSGEGAAAAIHEWLELDVPRGGSARAEGLGPSRTSLSIGMLR